MSIWPCQNREVYPCSVVEVLQWIPALWSGRHLSRHLSGFCSALSRLFPFHPDCSDCSVWRSVAVVLNPFHCLSSVQLYSHLWGRACLTSVGRIARSEWVLCLCWECHRRFSTACVLHSVEHFHHFFYVRLNSQVWVCLASFLSPQFRHCWPVSPRWLVFLCSTMVALLCELACELTTLTSHPCLTYTWTDIWVSVLAQFLVSVDYGEVITAVWCNGFCRRPWCRLWGHQCQICTVCVALSRTGVYGDCCSYGSKKGVTVVCL